MTGLRMASRNEQWSAFDDKQLPEPGISQRTIVVRAKLVSAPHKERDLSNLLDCRSKHATVIECLGQGTVSISAM